MSEKANPTPQLLHCTVQLYAALTACRTTSDTFCLVIRAASIINLISSSLKRTGTILPFASPLGSRGRPTLLGFFCCAKLELLYDCCPYRVLGRLHWMRVQHSDMPTR